MTIIIFTTKVILHEELTSFVVGYFDDFSFCLLIIENIHILKKVSYILVMVTQLSN